MTDTVGFIRNLPHRLIEAFKSTLEEAVLSDFLIQVVDASDPEAYRHYETTLEVLSELGAGDKPMIVVLNKVDAIEEDQRDAVIAGLKDRIDQPTIVMSVREQSGAPELLAACVDVLSHRVKTSCYCIPQYRADLVAQMHREGKVVSTEYEDNNVIVIATLPNALDAKLSAWKRD
jgi:GTP-binding protein HflX